MSNMIKLFVEDFLGKDIENIQKELDKFLDEAYKEAYVPSFRLSKGTYPKVNIIEKEGEYEIIAETPGVKKEDLKVTYQDGFLSISGVGNTGNTEKNDKYICKELKRSNFERSFRIDSEKIDIAKIKSSYELGELKILVPKIKNEIKNEYLDITIK